jgi:hypothetical protein
MISLTHQTLIQDFASKSFSGCFMEIGQISGKAIFYGGKQLSPDLHVLYHRYSKLVTIHVVANTVEKVAEFSVIQQNKTSAMNAYDKASKACDKPLMWSCFENLIETAKIYQDHVDTNIFH